MRPRGSIRKLRVLAMLLALGCAWSTAQAEPKPDQPAKGWIPTPAFTSPAMYQKFTLSPSLTVNLKADIPNVQSGYSVPGPFDFVAYAKASPFTEKWHIHIFKEGPGGIDLLTGEALQKFEGAITGYTFSLALDANFFKKNGPGKYGAKAYLSQTTPEGTYEGMITGRGFEIVNPTVNISDQKPGNVVGKPSAGIVAAVAKPNLSIIGVQAKIEPNCQAPQAAMTAIVTIKNAGGALPASKGYALVKEQGGANLGSAGIQLPAIGAGQTQTVNVAAITQQPYSSLAGAHQMHAVLNPQLEGGQPSFNAPAEPYLFSAVFPSGHCKSTATGSPKGGENYQAPAGQQPQGQPRPDQQRRR